MSGPAKRDLRHAARERRARLAAELRSSGGGAGGGRGRRGHRRDRAALRPRRWPGRRLRVAPRRAARRAASSSGCSRRVTRSSCPSCSTTSRSSGGMPPRGPSGDRGTVTRRRGAPTAGERSEWLGVDALVDVRPHRHARACRSTGTAPGSARAAAATTGRCVHRDPAAPVVTLLHEGEASEVDLPSDDHDLPVDAYVTTTGRLVAASAEPVEPAPRPALHARPAPDGLASRTAYVSRWSGRPAARGSARRPTPHGPPSSPNGHGKVSLAAQASIWSA